MNRHIFERVVQEVLVNGGTDGLIQVDDPTRFPIGAEVWLRAGGVSGQFVVVSYSSSPAAVRVRSLATPAPANVFDVSAYVAGSTITTAAQTHNNQLLPNENQLIPGVTTVIDVSAVDAFDSFVGGVMYRVVCSVNCWLKVGSAATASVDMLLVANVPEVFCFGHLGSEPVVHAIAGGAGKLYVTPMIPTLNG